MKMPCPELHSHNHFATDVHKKLCTECNIVSWNATPVVQCNFCDRWMHSGDEDERVKHCGHTDVNEMGNIFLCKTCMVKLINLYNNVFNDEKVDRIITFFEFIQHR